MNSHLRIRTPEGILFAYPLAGPITRCLAWAIDFFVITAIARGVSILLLVTAAVSLDVAFALNILAYFAVSIGYGIFTEWAWRGQTIGKRFLRLRVMDAQGLHLQFHQVLLRNLLRFVDILPGFYLVGGSACLLSRRAQRLGDLAANTVVVHHARYAEPDLDQLLAGKFNSLRQHSHLEARLRQRVSPDEARLALQSLIRRDELTPEARVMVFSDLAEHLKAIVTFPPETIESMPDEQYIRNVVDILFRTRSADSKPTRETAEAPR